MPLLFGERPMWRALGPSVADGVDVQQLEANLVALGVVTGSELTVDQNWTSATDRCGRRLAGVAGPGPHRRRGPG